MERHLPSVAAAVCAFRLGGGWVVKPITPAIKARVARL